MVNDIHPKDDVRVIPPAQSTLRVNDEDNFKKDPRQQQQQGKNAADKQEQPKPQPEPTVPLPGWEINLTNRLLQQRNTQLNILVQNDKTKRQHLQAELDRIKLGEQQHNNEQPVKTPQQTIELLQKLLSQYSSYEETLNKQLQAILANSTKDLKQILNTKTDILVRLRQMQAKINLAAFKDLPDDSPEKIKANLLLTDIHSKGDSLIIKEDEANTALIDRRESLKRELGALSTESRLLARYAVQKKSSRFVDTKK